MEREFLAAAIRHILSPEDQLRHPAYAALTAALSENQMALDLLSSVDERQQNPTLLLAILHLAALRGDETLTPLYESLNRGEIIDTEAFARTVVHYLEHHVEVVRAELDRMTQTNEVNRTAVLATVISDVARQLGHDEITLVDVGCSMGLNLFPDQVTIAKTDDGNPATLVTQCLSEGFVRSRVPRITRRIGVDQNLLSASDPEDVLWLKACLWPEERRRVQRFDAILAALPNWPKPEFRSGDAIGQVRQLLEEIGDEPVYLINSWVLYYFTDEDRVAWRALIDEYRAKRTIVWISFEHELMGLTLKFPHVPEPAPRKGATQVVVTSSAQDSTHWGWCHPHGHWFSVASGPKA